MVIKSAVDTIRYKEYIGEEINGIIKKDIKESGRLVGKLDEEELLVYRDELRGVLKEGKGIKRIRERYAIKELGEDEKKVRFRSIYKYELIINILKYSGIVVLVIGILLLILNVYMGTKGNIEYDKIGLPDITKIKYGAIVGNLIDLKVWEYIIMMIYGMIVTKTMCYVKRGLKKVESVIMYKYIKRKDKLIDKRLRGIEELNLDSIIDSEISKRSHLYARMVLESKIHL